MTTKVFSGARIVLGVLLAATLGVAAPAPAEAAAPTTAVDPGSLAQGAGPGIPWLDVDGGRIVRPERSAIPIRNAFGLFHVRGGFVTSDVRHEGRREIFRVLFVSDGGHRRVVTESQLAPDLVSADGRWLVLSNNRYGNWNHSVRLRVVRVSDGKTVGARTFPEGSAATAAARGRVVVRRPHSTVSWQVRGRSLHVLHGTGSSYGPATYVVPPASFGAGAFVTRAGRHDEMRSMATGRRIWRTSTGEFVLSFSPDDRRVVTASGFLGFNQEAPWELATTLRVRDARTGQVLRRFDGHFGVDRDSQPAWETARVLLLKATGEWVMTDPEDEGHYADPGVVRCTVSGSCERAPVDLPMTLIQRKSN